MTVSHPHWPVVWDWRPGHDARILILGATSGIGRAMAMELAQHGRDLILASRDLTEVERMAADVALRTGRNVRPKPFDALLYASHEALLEQCIDSPGALERLVLYYGDMCEQDQAEANFSRSRRMIEVNFASCVSVLNAAAKALALHGGGCLCVVSSVTDDRGRQSNYTYGATKAAIDVYLQGLRNRIYPKNVHVITVKPGFVDTPMT